MTDKSEDKSPIGDLSISNFTNLSIVEIIMLQMLLRHARPVVRHILYNEVSQFLRSEKEKVVESIHFSDLSSSGQKFYGFLQSKKKFSSSSLYYSLDSLESKGLVKFNYDKKNRVESVEATKFTKTLINTVLKHIIRFGLFEVEQNKILPVLIKEVVEKIESKKFGTMLYVWFKDFIDFECINTISTITDTLFILSKQEAFENVTKFGLDNIQYTALFNNTIRESDNFFDAVIIPYHYRNGELYETHQSKIIKEAFRIIKNSGVVIIHGYTDIPDIDQSYFDIFIEWVKNSFKEIVFYTEEEFKKELLDAGAKETEVFVYKGHLFGVGRK